MSRGSAALRELESWLGTVHDKDAPMTVRVLADLVRKAAEDTEHAEHDDYMGEDQ